jgi:hypothetical protein
MSSVTHLTVLGDCAYRHLTSHHSTAHHSTAANRHDNLPGLSDNTVALERCQKYASHARSGSHQLRRDSCPDAPTPIPRAGNELNRPVCRSAMRGIAAARRPLEAEPPDDGQRQSAPSSQERHNEQQRVCTIDKRSASWIVSEALRCRHATIMVSLRTMRTGNSSVVIEETSRRSCGLAPETWCAAARTAPGSR